MGPMGYRIWCIWDIGDMGYSIRDMGFGIWGYGIFEMGFGIWRIWDMGNVGYGI